MLGVLWWLEAGGTLAGEARDLLWSRISSYQHADRRAWSFYIAQPPLLTERRPSANENALVPRYVRMMYV